MIGCEVVTTDAMSWHVHLPFKCFNGIWPSPGTWVRPGPEEDRLRRGRMLPRHRDVVATIQTSGHAGSLANPTIPLLRWNGAAQRLENCERLAASSAVGAASATGSSCVRV